MMKDIQGESLVYEGWDPQALYDDLEKQALARTHFVIRNPGRLKALDMAVAAWVKKYQALVKSVTRDYQESSYFIELMRTDPHKSGDYQDIQNEYDANYYLNDCGGYDTFRNWGGVILDERLMKLLGIIQPGRDDVILDIGCGRGELTNAMARTAKKVIGVDYSEDAIKIAKKHFEGKENLEYICGDIVKMDFPEKFNKVVMADVFEHIQADAMDTLLRTLSQKIEQNAVLYIHTAPNLDWYNTVYAGMVKAARRRGDFLPANPRSRYEDRMHINEQSPRLLKETLKKFFSEVCVWTGEPRSLEELVDLSKQAIANEITAVAGFSPEIRNTVFSKPLDKESTSAEIECPEVLTVEGEDECGQEILFDLKVRNTGKTVLKSQIPFPVCVSYHVLDRNDQVLRFDNVRTFLPDAVYPGETCEVKVRMTLPDYLAGQKVQLDLLQESCFWFGINKELKIQENKS